MSHLDPTVTTDFDPNVPSSQSRIKGSVPTPRSPSHSPHASAPLTCCVINGTYLGPGLTLQNS